MRITYPVRPRRRRALAALLSAALALPAALVAAPPAEAATRHEVMSSAIDYARSHGYHVGIAVLDTRTGAFYGAGDYRGTFATESLVKVFIAARLLVSGRMVGSTRAAAYKMITQSDDAIASSLYPRVGGDSLITWVKAHYHVPDLGYPPSRANWWGNTHVRPEGLVHLYAKLKRDPRVGPWLLNAMHHATEYGSDGQYQFFGIPSATAHAAIKQGWGDDYDTWSANADFNTTGFVDGDRYAMAILARGPISSYGSRIGDLLTAVARRLMPGGVFPDPAPTISGLSVTSGPLAGGNRVTVHGSGFTHVRQVLFATTPGTNVTVVSPTTLRVDAPAHDRARVVVRVVTDHGSTGGVRYLFERPPAVGGLAAHDGSVTGGRRLLLRGRAFTAVRRVLFGATPATDVVTLSRWQLRVTVPAHAAGTVGVRVVSAYGTSPVTQAASFTYHDVPTVDSVTPATGSSAGGDTVTLGGTDVSSATKVLFGSAAATSWAATSDGHLVVTAPPHAAGLVNVRVQTPWGWSVRAPANRFTYTQPAGP